MQRSLLARSCLTPPILGYCPRRCCHGPSSTPGGAPPAQEPAEALIKLATEQGGLLTGWGLGLPASGRWPRGQEDEGIAQVRRGIAILAQERRTEIGRTLFSLLC
jgi:hypothetical protein